MAPLLLMLLSVGAPAADTPIPSTTDSCTQLLAAHSAALFTVETLRQERSQVQTSLDMIATQVQALGGDQPDELMRLLDMRMDLQERLRQVLRQQHQLGTAMTVVETHQRTAGCQ